MASTAFRGMKPFSQFMFALFVAVCTGVVLCIAATIVAIPFFRMEIIMNSFSPGGFNSPENIDFLKYFQVIQSIGFFVVPSFILAWLYHGKISDYLQINRNARWQSYVLVVFSILMLIPFINYLGALNSQMKFPEYLSGLEQKFKDWEEMAKVATEKFMKVESISGLLFNVFMIAILPALGEELMFRGVIQRIFTNWTKNYHWGIWITAFLFSAMHLQFYGFLPRMALGAMFGYLLVWSGTMWVPILAHFVNNTMGVLGYYLIDKGDISKDVEEWGTGSGQFPLVLFSLASAGLLLYLIYRTQPAETKMPASQTDSQASRID